MSRCAAFAFVVTMCVGLGSLVAVPAQAQLSRGNLRLSIDADMLSVAGVHIDGQPHATVVGLGPNQHGGGRLYSGPTPLGLGVGYVLQPNLILGLRFGLGYDVVAPSGAPNNTRILDISLMPGITFVPLGDRTKLFISAAPIFQVGRAKTLDTRDRTLLGGFGLGVGTFIFVTNAVSVDLGFNFEARFGGIERDGTPHRDVSDLRGLIRLGVSLWT